MGLEVVPGREFTPTNANAEVGEDLPMEGVAGESPAGVGSQMCRSVPVHPASQVGKADEPPPGAPAAFNSGPCGKTSTGLAAAAVVQLLREIHNDPNVTLTDAQKESFAALSRGESAVLWSALQESVLLKNDASRTAADYMFAVMAKAAQLSPDDGEQFVHLVALAFRQGRRKPLLELGRKVLMGEGEHPAGSAVEHAHYSFLQRHNDRATAGFRAEVHDRKHRTDSVTHHFGEFLRLGATRSKLVGLFVQEGLDGRVEVRVGNKGYCLDEANVGDIRVGSFAAMLGEGLRQCSISPRDAVRLTQWALGSGSTSAGPQWPNSIDKEATSYARYELSEWIKAYNEVHSDVPLK